MKENLEKLETLLNQISELIDKRIRIEEISIDEYTNRVLEMEDEYLKAGSQENIETFSKLNFAETFITDFISRKNDRSFFDVDIPKLKLLLTNMLSQIDNKNNVIEGTRFGSRLGPPNTAFKKLLWQNLLKTDTRISAIFDHLVHEGYLTKEGYFKLLLKNNGTKLFSSLSTAASFICNKPVVKGWDLWFANDKDGTEHSIEYFRKKIID